MTMSEKEKALLKELNDVAKSLDEAGKEMLVHEGNTIARYERLRRAKESSCEEKSLAAV
mgnify:CR=1 FL=1